MKGVKNNLISDVIIRVQQNYVFDKFKETSVSSLYARLQPTEIVLQDPLCLMWLKVDLQHLNMSITRANFMTERTVYTIFQLNDIVQKMKPR